MSGNLSKRMWIGTATGIGVLAVLFPAARVTLPAGMAYSGSIHVKRGQLLIDETWIDEEGVRHVDQEIFDAVFRIIDEAEEFILLDFFLVNDFLYEPGPGMRPLSQELTDRLLAKRRARPELPVVFITDPINSVYGSKASLQFKALEDAGVQVVWTDLDRLRDSNPIYSKPWRLFVRALGTGPGDALQNPLGEGRVSLRSVLKLLNFKANHRKLLVSEKSLLVTSANPHSASSAHWNVALRIDGAGQKLALESENAIVRLSGADVTGIDRWSGRDPEGDSPVPGDPLLPRFELLSERKIKDRILELLNTAEPEARIDLGMFYLSHRDVIDALQEAVKRGCAVRVILDPSKDAFGRIKNGIPNRQTAARLTGAGVPLRWADTHGEQFHVKMLYVEHPERVATVLLGSCNFTRRNLENYNAESSAAYTAPMDDAVLARVRGAFDRWWDNPDGRTYTADYEAYADPARWRMFRAWLMEMTGMCSF